MSVAEPAEVRSPAELSPAADPAGGSAGWPTVWGLSSVALHDRYWAGKGVQVVRAGEKVELDTGAELYLMIDPQTLAMFDLRPLLDRLYWAVSRLAIVRLAESQSTGYREVVVVGENQNFVRFERHYSGVVNRLTRVALTTDVRIARHWAWSDEGTSWKRLRREFGDVGTILSARGKLFDSADAASVNRFTMDVIRLWSKPDATIPNIEEVSEGVWAPAGTRVDPSVRFVGPSWIGAGRTVEPGESVLGPAALWDDPSTRFEAPQPEWQDIEPTAERRQAAPAQAPGSTRAAAPNRGSRLYPPFKRAFDIAFALGILAATLPLYPLIMIAIWIEDGAPFFFAHKRETRGGREFGCLKFRSMRKDAEKIKEQLKAAKANQADGPQFFMENDPRLTKVGKFLRATNLDELPQFVNVLTGDMSVVGPRPSPRAENQYSPSWRESRLSVRPGITGLWQVSRTRQAGTDFQEWIKYDLQYVENVRFSEDVRIILATFRVLSKR